MSGFREFLLQELAGGGYGYSPRMTRLAGPYDLPDLYTATQLGQPPIGGYQGFGHAAQWKAVQRQYNEKYPIKGLNITNTQMKGQLMDLAQRILAVAGVLDSKGTKPGDKSMTARVRYAHYDGQAIGTPANSPGVNKNIIRNVDGRVFTGEVSGRGGTIGFEIGETLGIIRPTSNPIGDYTEGECGSTGTSFPLEKNMQKGVTPCPICGQNDWKPITGNHYDLFIDRLRAEMGRALEHFRQFERSLQASTFIGSQADKIANQVTTGSAGGMAGVRTSAGSMFGQAAMRKD